MCQYLKRRGEVRPWLWMHFQDELSQFSISRRWPMFSVISSELRKTLLKDGIFPSMSTSVLAGAGKKRAMNRSTQQLGFCSTDLVFFLKFQRNGNPETETKGNPFSMLLLIETAFYVSISLYLSLYFYYFFLNKESLDTESLYLLQNGKTMTLLFFS